jgi:predicted PurR-regulated permease PerM
VRSFEDRGAHDSGEPSAGSRRAGTTTAAHELLDRYDIAAYGIMGSLIVGALALHLTPAALSGLLIFEIVHTLAPRVVGRRISAARARLAAVALLALLVIGVTIGAGAAAVSEVRSEGGGFSALLQKMAEIVEGSREMLPEWMHGWLPKGDADAIKESSAHWLREHATELTRIGGEAGSAAMHALIGMVLGALISLRSASAGAATAPLARALTEQVTHFSDAFRQIVFAQTRVSALNTILTGLYLVVALPLFGAQLPFIKTMILATFVIGLMPIIGNLITNTIIVVISLSHSVGIAVSSLVFLVVIHKLEYFVNARLVAGQIKAAAWEILVAMLVMESLFGLPGIVIAPIVYAYVKRELSAHALI